MPTNQVRRRSFSVGTKLAVATVMVLAGLSFLLFKELTQRKDGEVPVDGVLMRLGRVYVDAGKKSDAEQTFNRLVEEFPDSPFSGDARRELDQALRANPRYADAWAELGLVQTRAEQYADAEQSLAKALAIDPRNYAATFNLSTLYSKTKDPRRDEQAARLATLQEQRAVQAQEFLRIVEVSPY